MSNNRTDNIDGFVLRRRPQQSLGGVAEPSHVSSRGPAATGGTLSATAPRLAASGGDSTTSTFRRSDIDESLRAIDESTPPKRPKKRQFGKIVKRLAIVVVLIGLSAGVYTLVNIVLRTSQVFHGNILNVFENKPLKTDENGLTNILLFGTSEDDPSHIAEQSGTQLTDSIMIVSVDQKAKTAAMVSIPRDLWVKYGTACSAGYEGKINAAYQCGLGNSENVDAGAAKLGEMISNTIGVQPQYYAKVGYKALKDSVDAVGGITVKIDSDDPRGVYDPNFDWQCAHRCHLVKWPNGDQQLDGEHALALARSRNAAGGYGLGGGNFDREQYQQKIIVAIKDKATTSGTLANPVTINKLIDTIGTNVKTSFDASEIRTMTGLLKDIDVANIRQVSLIDEAKPMVTTGNVGGQSVVRPVAGLYSYGQMTAFVLAALSGDTSATEQAAIEVLNASGVVGAASQKVTELTASGLTATAGDATTQATLKQLQWYDLSANKMPGTKKKLSKTLGMPSAGTVLPDGVQSDADFVILLGNGSH
jgi:polyisoprenyl-teichoic acid--peptidoglycan teichoic acid transferase